MEGSIVVGKTASYTICFDTVQWGVARNKDRKNVNFFAKPVKKDKPENAINIENIKVHGNIVTLEDGEVNRLSIKDKKAKSIPGAKCKVADAKKDRLTKAFEIKYGPRKNEKSTRTTSR